MFIIKILKERGLQYQDGTTLSLKLQGGFKYMQPEINLILILSFKKFDFS